MECTAWRHFCGVTIIILAFLFWLYIWHHSGPWSDFSYLATLKITELNWRKQAKWCDTVLIWYASCSECINAIIVVEVDVCSGCCDFSLCCDWGGGGLALCGTGTLHCWAENVDEVVRRFTDSRRIDRSKLMDDSAYRWVAVNSWFCNSDSTAPVNVMVVHYFAIWSKCKY